MRIVKVVKRKEREAANDLEVAADQTPTLSLMTAEMVVKSWITATRKRHKGEIKKLSAEFQKKSVSV